METEQHVHRWRIDEVNGNPESEGACACGQRKMFKNTWEGNDWPDRNTPEGFGL